MSEPAPDERPLRLDQFLKREGLVGTGGQAKVLIQSGEVQVNGETETRRGRKLRLGDRVALGDQERTVEAPDEERDPGSPASR